MPFNIGPGEIVLVLAIALLVLGPGKLPEVGASLGKTIREFRKNATDVQEAASLEPRPTSAPPSQATAPTPDEVVEGRRTDATTVPPAREA
jgi:TatA/E family protein of Tat protein translocase